MLSIPAEVVGSWSLSSGLWKEAQQSGTRACRVSVKCQGMQNDDIMECDMSLQ